VSDGFNINLNAAAAGNMRKIPGRHRRVLILFSVLLLPLSITLSSTVASSTSVSPLSNPAMNAPGYTSDPLGDLTNQIGHLGFTQYPSTFASVSENESTATITVYVTSLDATMENAMTAEDAVGKVAFVIVPKTLSELDALHALTTDDMPDLTSHGIDARVWHAELLTGREYIGVLNLTANQTNYIDQVLGASNVDVENLAPGQVPVSTASRTNDTAPFNGGDSIENTSSGPFCTSGFGATIGSTSVLITAAHCFALNSSVINGLNGTGGFASIGSVSHRDMAYQGTDTETINGSSSDLIWSGVIGSPTEAFVSGYTSSPAGDQVCNSGSASGEVCGITISSTTIYTGLGTCITVLVDGSNRTECHLIYATAASGAIANESGDSGGPVFRFSGSNLEATGIVSASTMNDTVNCVYNTNQICYNDLYYTAISTTLNEWGATLKTG